jgi:phenylalanyl-tRNA synthetase beta chain
MKFSLKWITKYTALPLDNREALDSIIDQIAYQVVDVDKREMLDGDALIDIDNKIITNRPYAFGHRGLAREIAIMLNQDYQAKYPVLISKTADLPLTVEVKDADLCPRFTALTIKGITIGPSPLWLKEALEAIGQRSINNLVDITNYVMLDTAQPVHAYDYHKIAQQKIIVRRAGEGEKVITLDGVERTLNNDVLLITDSEKPIGIGGVMGAGNSEIDENTKDIVLEVASFNPLNIRQTARFLKHRTDAVQRFEKGQDPTNIPNVLSLLAELVIEVCGGSIASDCIDVANLDQSTLRHQPYTMDFDPFRVNKLLGFGLDLEFIQRILAGFDITYTETEKDSGTIWNLTIPAYRSDIKEPADLIEDIGRMYGYQNIPSIVPVNQLRAPERNTKIESIRKIRAALNASGLDEVVTYAFISDADIEAFDLKDAIPLINPISQEYKYLRNSVVPSLARVAELNAKYNNQFGVFEVARKFVKKQGRIEDYSVDHGASQQPDEIEVVSMLYYDKAQKEQSIFTLKGALESIMTSLGIKDYSLRPNGEIQLENKVVGSIALLTEKERKAYDLDCVASYIEIELKPLIEAYNANVTYAPFSRFQGTQIDYSVLIPVSQSVEEVLRAIPAHEWITSKEVVDVYKGLKDVKDKKSISIRLYLQKMDSTITSSEVYDLGVSIEEKLNAIAGLEIRGGGVRKPTDYQSSTKKEESDSKPTIVVGQIIDIHSHPDADRLVVCTVDVKKAQPQGTLSDKYLQIVTGAANIKPGIAEDKLVPVALPGAEVLSYKTGERFTIGISKLRGEVSEGMLCAKSELGLPDDQGGIWILDDSYINQIGEKFEPPMSTTPVETKSVPTAPMQQELQTKQLYLTDSYLKEMDAKILEVVKESEGRYKLLLDQTVFYVMGGGQSTDQGELTSPSWNGHIYQVTMQNGQIWHFVQSDTEPEAGAIVHGIIDWERRYKNMKLHSAGHIIDFALYMLGYTPKQLIPLKGEHSKNPHIVYKGAIGKDITLDLKQKANEIVTQEMVFKTSFLTGQELADKALYIQPGLPTNKQLRALELVGVGIVADGGTQISNTKEVGEIDIRIEIKDEYTTVYYNIA